MIILGLKINLITNEGSFGFKETFGRNLTVIKAGNSGGKSTLVSTILYALGMEEILGGKGENVLPYCLSTYFDYEARRIEVIASEIYLEVENSFGEIRTFRRVIKDKHKSSKLIEIYSSRYISSNERLGIATATYVHDAGGAKREEGFHFYLEKFLNLSLPEVGATSGGMAKLYLQTIFSAHAIEQKRGWTDYLANIPFYGIRDPKTRVVEYLLGLEVFDINALKNNLVSNLGRVTQLWQATNRELLNKATEIGLNIEGIYKEPSLLFNPDELTVFAKDNYTIDEYIIVLKREYEELVRKERAEYNISSEEILKQIEVITDELQLLTIGFEQLNSKLINNRISISTYQEMLYSINEDLGKNKAALKLRDLGAKLDLEISEDKCPTCFQHIIDNLLAEEIKGPQMDLKEQIEHLNSQKKMLEKQIDGILEENNVIEIKFNNTKKEINRKRNVLDSLRKSVTSGTEMEKLYIRRQIYIENEVKNLENFKERFSKCKSQLQELLQQFQIIDKQLKQLPKDFYSVKDFEIIKLFENFFKGNARKFHYESAQISDIIMSKDNLLPSLAHMELREIRRSSTKTDSSASDFVRLIWSYLIALYQASNVEPKGNHLNFLLLDEPGQHSMAQQSQRALLLELSSYSSLQSIVAASFDESEAIFHEVTNQIKFKLITWQGKLIKPLIN
ncbi:Uncharacterised protein [Acinetobacter baumannii]|uniref:hypothetical protein n=1 Tax=Acinetobacter baumannii TaxID=470 RepID=UPI000DE5E7C2|nr:hypothetical protein [Acinetobacter baumannii]MDV7431462.1 hypothetical protein [Acinetobacter baumannii]SSR35393.1 Uncharacterised protein [Acinetobacter baumannii]HCE0436868.1 hypothetical protein [Acinetobacter baumannii]